MANLGKIQNSLRFSYGHNKTEITIKTLSGTYAEEEEERLDKSLSDFYPLAVVLSLLSGFTMPTPFWKYDFCLWFFLSAILVSSKQQWQVLIVGIKKKTFCRWTVWQTAQVMVKVLSACEEYWTQTVNNAVTSVSELGVCIDPNASQNLGSVQWVEGGGRFRFMLPVQSGLCSLDFKIPWRILLLSPETLWSSESLFPKETHFQFALINNVSKHLGEVMWNGSVMKSHGDKFCSYVINNCGIKWFDDTIHIKIFIVRSAFLKMSCVFNG